MSSKAVARAFMTLSRPLALAALCWMTQAALAQDTGPPGTRVMASKFGFDALVQSVEKAVEKNKMGSWHRPAPAAARPAATSRLRATRC